MVYIMHELQLKENEKFKLGSGHGRQSDPGRYGFMGDNFMGESGFHSTVNWPKSHSLLLTPPTVTFLFMFVFEISPRYVQQRKNVIGITLQEFVFHFLTKASYRSFLKICKRLFAETFETWERHSVWVALIFICCVVALKCVI